MTSQMSLDGNRVFSYDDFVAEFNREYLRLFGPPSWDGQSFEDLDDFLEMAKPLKICWIHSTSAKAALGYREMAEFRMRSLEECKRRFPNADYMLQEISQAIEEALSERGPTLFEYLCWQMQSSDCEILCE